VADGGRGDPVHGALAKLKAAEWAAAPWYSIDAMSFALIGTSGLDHLTPDVELREASHPAAEPSRIAEQVRDAEVAFRAAGLVRGVARTHLVHGYLLSLAGDWAAAAASAGTAARMYGSARDAFGSNLAAAHRSLYEIGDDSTRPDIATARMIGRWGAGDGAFSFALGIGLLASRLGRHFMLRRGKTDSAAGCHRWAAALFGALGASMHETQELVRLAEASESAGAFATAIRELDTAHERCTEAARADTLTAPLLQGMASEINARYYRLAQKRMDPAALLAVSACILNEAREADAASSIQSQSFHTMHSRRLGRDDVDVEVDAASVVGELALLAKVRDVVAFDMAAQAACEAACYRGRELLAEGLSRDKAEGQFKLALDSADNIEGPERYSLRAVAHAFAGRTKEAAREFDEYVSAAAGSWVARLAASFPGAGGRLLNQQAKQQSLRMELQFFPLIGEYARAWSALARLIDAEGPEFWRSDDKPWETLADVAATYRGMRRSEEALQCYEEAMRIIEQQRQEKRLEQMRMSFSDSKVQRDIYLGAVHTTLDAAPSYTSPELAERRAFAYLERGKGRALMDLMQPLPVGQRGVERPQLRDWRMALNELAAMEQQFTLALAHDGRPETSEAQSLRERLEKQRVRVQSLEAILAAENRAFLQTAVASPPDIDAIADAIPEDVALAAYAVDRHETTCFLMDRAGIRRVVRRQADTVALHGCVNRYYRSAGRDRSEARNLQALLLDGLAPALDDYGRLLIVPFGPLHRLPFNTLSTAAGPLVESHTLSVLPSASLVPLLAAEQRRDPSVVCVGNGEAMTVVDPFDPRIARRYQALPLAAVESAIVASLYESSRTLDPSSLTPAAFVDEAAKADVVHLAAHAAFVAHNPMMSSIIAGQDAVLTLYELMGSHLRADLMVVSSCASGLGSLTAGDESVGLTRGLLASGVQHAVVSLWPVQDAVALLTMAHFHDFYSGGASAARSLQLAQQHVQSTSEQAAEEELAAFGVEPELLHTSNVGRALRGLSDPVGWAPFQTIGLP
jgi:CHAT domain-containing protein